MMRAALAIGCVCALAACGSQDAERAADIAKVAAVGSSFGPGYTVKDIPKTGIDPNLLSSHNKLPEGLKFEPADCAKFVVGQDLPAGLQGNMAAVSAEGNGNRFIVIAMQTSRPMPFNDPGRDCRQVGFAGRGVRGGVEVVDAPKIDGARTLGVHRVVQAAVGGQAVTGEVYTYSAQFGDYQVVVTANPLLVPDKSVAPVDTNRARDLLVKAVADVRS